MNKVVTFILLLILSIVELGMTAIYLTAGIDAMPTFIFIAFLWNLGVIIGLFCHLISKNRTQSGGYMEVSNYLNLNKIANKDDK